MKSLVSSLPSFVSSLHPVTSVGSILLATGSSILFWIQRNRKREFELAKLRPGRLVVITGCDSGLGLAMSYWAGQVGYKVLAGCYNPDSDGARFLQKEFSEVDLKVTQLDVTQTESLENFRITCQNILHGNGNSTKLWAVIPNAAVASFGEFMWMTDKMSRQMMDVNFWGTVNFTKAFHPLLLHYKSRLIVITSDCADFPLPGLSVYSASKAALQCWAAALRLEMAKFDVSVTSFQPGNFPTQSRLFAGQRLAYEEMKSAMSPEDETFYGDYFHEYNNGLINLFESMSTKELRDDKEIQSIFHALLEKNIKSIPMETQNPIVLKCIHFLFQHLPIRASDWLKLRLMKPPTWHAKEYPLKYEISSESLKIKE